MAIAFACPKCAKKFKVKSELAGKSVKCPCGAGFKVPSPKSIPKAVPKPVAKKKVARAKADDFGLTAFDDSGMGSLLDEVDLPSAAAKNACPSCKHPLGESAVLCIKCGYQLSSGKKLSTASDQAAEKSKGKRKSQKSKMGGSKAASKVAFGGSLLRGTLFSLIGAGLGGVAWAAVATFTGMSIGWLAWGLGGAAGVGMSLGHEDDDGTLAGIIASGCSLLGLFGAKAFIYFIILLPILSLVNNVDAFAMQFDESNLVGHFTAEILDRKGIEPGEATDDEQSNAEQSATERVDSMTEDQKLQAVEDMKQKFRQTMDKIKAESDMDDSLLHPTFLGIMFSPIDGIFMLLAVATAYRIGSGQAT